MTKEILLVLHIKIG